MKKTALTTTFLVAGAVGLLAQGLVTFDNNPYLFSDSLELGGNVEYKIFQAPGVPVSTVDNPAWRAAIFQGANQLGAVLPFDPLSPGVVTTANDPAFGNRGPVAGAVGDTVKLTVSVFDGTGKVLGSSQPFDYKIPAATAPPESFYIVNFRGFVVPEPSTVALGVLGLGALLLFRRRK